MSNVRRVRRRFRYFPPLPLDVVHQYESVAGQMGLGGSVLVGTHHGTVAQWASRPRVLRTATIQYNTIH